MTEGVLDKHTMFDKNPHATMLLLCCFPWEETFGWLSTAYVRLSVNTSLQSSASCCHSSRFAHQLNPLSCGWAGRQVSGQHPRLQLLVFPSVPVLPRSTYPMFTPSSSLHRSPHVEIKLIKMYVSYPLTHFSCCNGGRTFFKLGSTLQCPLQGISAPIIVK